MNRMQMCGRVSQFTDGEGCVTDYDYEPRGMAKATDYYKPDPAAVHSINTYEFNDQGNCRYATDPNNYTTTHDYDLMNRNWRALAMPGRLYMAEDLSRSGSSLAVWQPRAG